ncbi:DUF6069 family protein [Streptomyces sp. NBC_00015]|uniref:DUF6069 family protein n=1 Tax=Streptomyces sp. NBC_00015 TaxID=2903611 RepID=UPI0038650C83
MKPGSGSAAPAPAPTPSWTPTVAPRGCAASPRGPGPSHAVNTSLTAISSFPPLLSEVGTATTTALIGLHLVPATVAVPTLARSLSTRTDRPATGGGPQGGHR